MHFLRGIPSNVLTTKVWSLQGVFSYAAAGFFFFFLIPSCWLSRATFVALGLLGSVFSCEDVSAVEVRAEIFVDEVQAEEIGVVDRLAETSLHFVGNTYLHIGPKTYNMLPLNIK